MIIHRSSGQDGDWLEELLELMECDDHDRFTQVMSKEFGIRAKNEMFERWQVKTQPMSIAFTIARVNEYLRENAMLPLSSTRYGQEKCHGTRYPLAEFFVPLLAVAACCEPSPSVTCAQP